MRVLLGLATCAVIAGCGSDPADVAGNYTIAVTNRDNGCNFANWTVGAMASGIAVSVTQSQGDANATVEGLTGAFLQAALGSKIFTGSVHGHDLDLELVGTNATTSGNCTYTYNAILTGTLNVDALIGTITYTAATNDQSDCTGIEGCESVQDFNGTRPPT